MNPSRRHFTQLLAGSALTSSVAWQESIAATPTSWHEQIAQAARNLAEEGPLHLLIPEGSAANVTAATNAFRVLTGIECVITQVPPDDINVELILRAAREQSEVDVALPATYGLSDLAEAGAIEPLNDFAKRYEPPGFFDGHRYRKGDFHQGNLYGYQTDGDVYLLFYNKRMLEDPVEQAVYESLTGKPLRAAQSWEELDAMMAFFHRPAESRYGGCLFRNPLYLVWEWWARFHAKGYFPVSDGMVPNINNAAGVTALRELLQASAYQSPGSGADSFLQNWARFSDNNVFCCLGWGGTQKYLMGNAEMQGNLVHSQLPSPMINGQRNGMGYFNWGWNYTVSSRSRRKELAYLLTLFCVSPVISTLAVREVDGYFDPFRQSHYEDADIERAYGRSFLDAHESSLLNSIPDFYVGGQGGYLDALRQQIMAVSMGEYEARLGLDNCARQWNHLTRRLGVEKQRAQWQVLKNTYPAALKNNLRNS